MNTFAIKGNIMYTPTAQNIKVYDEHLLVCENGEVAGIFKELPEKYKGIEIIEYKNQLIVPGFIDLHVHAPQYSFRGLGMDLELLEWLNINAFPEEAKYSDLEYANRAYGMFIEDLKLGATARACIFATIHKEATLLLMEELENTGLCTMVGKVNMDRNSPDILREENAEKSLAETKNWVEKSKKFKNTIPILTPRFIPSCTDKLMYGLGELQHEYKVPLQSHLSENLSEIELVKSLCPNSKNYGDAYNKFGLFGGENCKTVMAHCVYSDNEELELIKKNHVFIAHCPNSNTNISSGIAPVRTYLDKGIKIGLGSDVAGGFSASMFRAMSDTIQVSKLRWRILDNTLKPINMNEAFYMCTKGGGEFFGKVGSFEKGYEFDAVILDDKNIPCPFELSTVQRFERIMYLGDNNNVKAKFVKGKKIT